MKSYEATMSLLKALKLNGIFDKLDELITDAESRKISYIGFMQSVLQSEVHNRRKKRYERNLSGARFPIIKKIDSFQFGLVKGIGKTDAINLLDCRWIDKKENLLFFGPPGIGKSHLAIGFGVHAVEQGYTVCFERCLNLMKLLKLKDIQKSAEYRIRNIMKAQVLIIDEIGYTPIEKRESNLFFNL